MLGGMRTNNMNRLRDSADNARTETRAINEEDKQRQLDLEYSKLNEDFSKANINADVAREGQQNVLENTRLGGQQSMALQQDNNQFRGKEGALERSLKTDEAAKQREFMGGQEQKRIDAGLVQERNRIAGQALAAGVGGNQVQQILNSSAETPNVTGIQAPLKADIATPWEQMKEMDSGG